ncbi:MAG: hypothetical protein M3Z26_11000 [Bacteroidota bacterium]|nr:hypothetical protein [Bacteroidota bacterium]
MTGDKTTAATKPILVSTDGRKYGFKIILMQSLKGSLIFDIEPVEAGHCIYKEGEINILFTDGSIMHFQMMLDLIVIENQPFISESILIFMTD